MEIIRIRHEHAMVDLDSIEIRALRIALLVFSKDRRRYTRDDDAGGYEIDRFSRGARRFQDGE